MLATYHGFDNSFLDSMDDSAPSLPINIQGETPQHIKDYITSQAMDQILQSDEILANADESLRNLIDDIINNLRVPIQDVDAYELAKVLAYSAGLHRLTHFGAQAASTSVVVQMDTDYFQMMIMTAAACAIGAMMPTSILLHHCLMAPKGCWCISFSHCYTANQCSPNGR